LSATARPAEKADTAQELTGVGCVPPLHGCRFDAGLVCAMAVGLDVISFKNGVVEVLRAAAGSAPRNRAIA